MPSYIVTIHWLLVCGNHEDIYMSNALKWVYFFLNHTSLYEYKDNGQMSKCNFSIDEFKNLSLFNSKRKNQWAKCYFSI